MAPEGRSGWWWAQTRPLRLSAAALEVGLGWRARAGGRSGRARRVGMRRAGEVAALGADVMRLEQALTAQAGELERATAERDSPTTQ